MVDQGFEWLPKVQKITQSGPTALGSRPSQWGKRERGSNQIVEWTVWLRRELLFLLKLTSLDWSDRDGDVLFLSLSLVLVLKLQFRKVFELKFSSFVPKKKTNFLQKKLLKFFAQKFFWWGRFVWTRIKIELNAKYFPFIFLLRSTNILFQVLGPKIHRTRIFLGCSLAILRG